MENYPIVPGRGLVTPYSTKLRQDYLDEQGYSTTHIAASGLLHSDIQNKIESYIGSVEIPIGLVGPLLHIEEDGKEWVYAGAATLEGALVASMNRGAKAASMSGGIATTFVHQKMSRCPMFIFNSTADAGTFYNWLPDKFEYIKKEAQKHSNHARLLSIEPVLADTVVHARFFYRTGDASGQNMTTTCTWHALLFIVSHFTTETGIAIKNYVIEGNGSSDKKVSSYSVENGRGVRVMAECYLKEAVIENVLRTTSQDIVNCFTPSVALANNDNMFSYNINVANTIAAIFAATGQDLGCVHESSVGMLHLEKTDDGLYISLVLPTLVVGTVGGGTSVPKQKEMLELMKCYGQGKLQRFAQLIAAFALSLEISTYAAIVSGAFAKAHEKLGRNKPVNWLTRTELNQSLVRGIMGSVHAEYASLNVSFVEKEMENGIITNLTSKTSNKLIGFFPFTATGPQHNLSLLIKSKASDQDIIKGLHSLAAAIEPALSDLIYAYRNHTEYYNCHLKELFIYEDLHNSGFCITPKYFGKKENVQREIYLLAMEYLQSDAMHLFNTENKPEMWRLEDVKKVIEAITKIHQHYYSGENQVPDHLIRRFDPSQLVPLYEKLIAIILKEEASSERSGQFKKLPGFLKDITQSIENSWPVCVIHNDFNPRNVGIRSNAEVCIYDWELAVKNIPHRDIVEFLAFVLVDRNDISVLKENLGLHADIWGKNLEDNEWLQGYVYGLKEFMICRMSFYKVSEILMKLKFPDRVMDNCFAMLSHIEAMIEANKRYE
ncbi:phosphotransferase [Xanthocytophaga agilis]|uniref:hydroxymethylglutaryl-CoA reductase (NADPH) n=1 Tax=Xanthocytophaga agilis TaxID=3048010 RepID=A0AAE3RCR9_9BACT|nr:phosphotransferase [Xanthocytophaga agilis]MDJ1505909.1 phosphotransferase [Xanthocytophaga agilis]